MEERLVVRGGRLVDGSGMPSFSADVEIVDGTITAVGRIPTAGAQVLDADGLVVAPGFVDLHTHYDAQLHFEPTASPSSWHGVTTVAVSNCGFGLAPASLDGVQWLCKMLSRVEGMSEASLAAGVTFAGGTMADFLGGLDGRVGVNMASYVGHAAVRRWVMGEAASERAATAEEIDAMASVVHQAMAEGAIGFSTSQVDQHRDHLGRPVPPNLASTEEIVALAGAVAEFAWGSIAMINRSFAYPDGYDADDRRLLREVAEASGKIIHGPVIGWLPPCPEAWRPNIAFAEEMSAKGHRFIPLLTVNPKGLYFSLDSTFLFDDYPTWGEVLVLAPAERNCKLSDRSVRAAMARELEHPDKQVMRFSWDELVVAVVRKAALDDAVGKRVGELAAQRGVDPLDAMLDLALEDDLRTIFAVRRPDHGAERAVIDQLVDHPLVSIGSSDGGAHLLSFCGADYTTRLLTEWVSTARPLEHAVAKLTSLPAARLGLWDRGYVRPGFAGDLVLFDPDRLGVGPAQIVDDFPAGAERLVFAAEGYHATVVNGTVVMENAKDTGARPGHVLRGGRRERSLR